MHIPRRVREACSDIWQKSNPWHIIKKSQVQFYFGRWFPRHRQSIGRAFQPSTTWWLMVSEIDVIVAIKSCTGGTPTWVCLSIVIVTQQTGNKDFVNKFVCRIFESHLSLLLMSLCNHCIISVLLVFTNVDCTFNNFLCPFRWVASQVGRDGRDDATLSGFGSIQVTITSRGYPRIRRVVSSHNLKSIFLTINAGFLE